MLMHPPHTITTENEKANPMPNTAALCCPEPRRRQGLLPRLFALLSLRRQRGRLRDLPPHMLRDIGLSPEEARAEADRPIWDVPPHWRA